MQAIRNLAQPTHRTLYSVAGKSIVVQAQDAWAANVIEKLFAGWYLTPAGVTSVEPAEIVLGCSTRPNKIPEGWQEFEIAGGGVCGTHGKVTYIDIDGSIISVGAPGRPTVEVQANGPLPIQSPVLTRVVTYALAAALRRRGLFELHSGAVVDPRTGKGVLIIGPSGSGKSTLTVQLSASGWPFLTDDVLALSLEGTEVKAWPLRRSFAITADTFAASQFLQASASLDFVNQRRDEKTLFIPHDVFGSQFRENCVPRTLFFSQISGAERSQVSPLAPGETMARFIRMNPWSCYDRATAAKHLSVLSALVKQSRGYALVAGKDLLDPDISARLIARYSLD